MKPNDYVRLANRTRVNIGDKEKDVAHMIYGMLTELGELADVYKKGMAYKKNMDMINVREEIGDIMWYIAGLCDIEGFDLDKIMEINIAKLQARYPEKFDEEKALNRNLDVERGILEQ